MLFVYFIYMDYLKTTNSSLSKKMDVARESEIDANGIITISFDKHVSRLCIVTSKSNSSTAIGMRIIVTSISGIINYIEIFKGANLDISKQDNILTIKSTSTALCNLLLISLDSKTL